MQKRGLIGSFMAVDGQVTSVHAKAEWDSVKFPELDAATGKLLRRSDYPAANYPLKGVGGNVPSQKAEAKQAEHAKREKQFPQNAPALRRGWLGRWFRRGFDRVPGRFLGQGLLSPAAGSGARMWLPERRLASHPESSSFIFFSASNSLIREKTSVNGVARLPAFFISGTN